MTIQAIETQYKGYRFRSRLEARWAVFFDALGLEWQYETEGYELDGVRYLPDFYLPNASGSFMQKDGGAFVEIKPGAKYEPSTGVYLAGKMLDTNNDDWRRSLIQDIRTKCERYIFTGPFAMSHNDGERDIVETCLSNVDESDYVFANFGILESPGTLVELGYAKAKNKKLLVRFEQEEIQNDLWFVRELVSLADGKSVVGGGISDLLLEVLPKLTTTFDKCRRMSALKRTVLMQGDPLDCHVTLFSDCNEYDWGCSHLQRICDVFLGSKNISISNAARKARSARFEFGEAG